MAMKRCPVCGEKYSDTYKRCPFCEEEESLRRGDTPRRRGGHRVAPSHQGPSLLSPILILVILAMLAVLVYLLFGNQIAEKLHLGTSSSAPAASSVTEPAIGGASSGAASASGSAAASSSAGSGTTGGSDPSALPETLSLSKQDFTMNVGDAPVQLSVKGGTGTYSWSSDDDGVASVDSTGKVTAISSGTVNIYASDGTGKGVCIVRIKGTGTPNPGAATGTGTGVHKLSSEDFTTRVGEPSVKLTVSGVTSGITWTSADTSIATVSADGTVKAVGAGTTTVTASWEGQSLSCIVRVRP
jgi:hypothetical protein